MQQTNDSRVSDLVSRGELRVGLGLGSPALVMRDPPSGRLHGPALELARALANRIGIDLTPITYPRPGAVMDGVDHEWSYAGFWVTARSGGAV